MSQYDSGEFSLTNVSEVSPGVVFAAQRAISVIRNSMFPDYTEKIVIEFYPRAYDQETGENMNIAEVLNGDNSITIVTGSDSFRSFRQELTEEQTVTILAAHAATHLAQKLRGDNWNGSRYYENRDEYLDSPEEIESWSEALQVFIKFYPDWAGREIIVPNGRAYLFPRVSKY